MNKTRKELMTMAEKIYLVIETDNLVWKEPAEGNNIVDLFNKHPDLVSVTAHAGTSAATEHISLLIEKRKNTIHSYHVLLTDGIHKDAEGFLTDEGIGIVDVWRFDVHQGELTNKVEMAKRHPVLEKLGSFETEEEAIIKVCEYLNLRPGDVVRY